ncbi:M1 family metallopeptidase [Bowmanella sp. JS7-9]|uniref:Aminopeptidase n=1 Tax=Pseudobowmanella zhangzhouensis TaxID=1537679 RepID=A0ABW1XGX4_9ALTE|nr:M1 family metallopeptidase [Bowmanella sp. JS7-9]TBX20918.1 peptidase M1 [Bowmanella sp. JS7-9]
MKIRNLLTGASMLLAASWGSLVQASASDEVYRLPQTIQPTLQTIDLTVDPDSPDYQGETTISLDIQQPTDKVGFYKKELTILSAELVSEAGTIPLSIEEASNEIFWAKSSQTIAAGKYQFTLRFEGKINTSSDGMYLSNHNGRNYIFTQFEDMDARRAFPSFDEPSFKIPYELTITAPQKHTVVANTPVETTEQHDGWQTVHFMRTKPMPSYIIAYAVGELDSIEINNLSVPGRIYAPKGEAVKTSFIAKHTAEILQNLEAYFGMPYPYRKLDLIAVPNFTFGAMENAGLVTFRSELLILDEQPNLNERAAPLMVVAHELAHMWYGDLVTMAWWDDLWLNEAFASWMASRVMTNLYPELGYQNNLNQEGAFGQDANPLVRPIKKTVKTSADVMDGMGLNYSKGEAVLLMIEAMIGEQAFQKGVQAYMRKHAWQNTVADDLWNALAANTDIDLPALMKTFLTQPGYPLVNITADGNVTQSRFKLAGAEVTEQLWHLPLRLKFKKAGKVQRLDVLMTEKSVQIDAIKGADWVYADADAVGYYRWNIPANQLSALLADVDQLNERERKSLIYGSKALMDAEQRQLDQHLQVISAMATDNSPEVVRAAFNIIARFEYLVNKANKQAFANYIESIAMPSFDQLGFQVRSSDDRDTIKLRGTVLRLLAMYSKNPAFIATATTLAEKFLTDPTSVNVDLASVALATRALNAEKPAEIFKEYQAAYIAQTDARLRDAIASGMVFEDEKIINQVFDMSLNPAVSPANAMRFVWMGMAKLEDRDLMYKWMNANFDALSARIPAAYLGQLPQFIGSSCSEHNQQLANAFFKPLVEKVPAMQRSLDVMNESTSQCIKVKQQNQPAFNKYLQSL